MQHYLTTPIYYASGAPHLGHAYTTLIADCVKRYLLLRGDAAMLITGTDEHGQKIERTAQTAGIAPQTLVDELSKMFRDTWALLGIDVDRFERTTSATHEAFAQAFWSRLAERDEIYLDTYTGRYCVECEQYFTAGETCPVHRRPLETFEEASWFFRLSRYRDRLITHIETNETFILPIERRNEVLAFLKGGELKDLSISRTSTRWGIPVPGDAEHVMYVWIDALVAYLSALAPSLEAFETDDIQRWWRNTTHFIGKDILTFHAVYWPALLMAAGIALPRSLMVNGWLTAFGRKISKSDPETIVDPVELTEKVGRDGLKWYFLKTVQLGQDVDYSSDTLVQTVNADLANNLGNLFSRFAGLASKRLAEAWRAPGEPTAMLLRDNNRVRAVAIAMAFEAGNPPAAARAFIDAAAAVNAWFQQAEPWKVADEAGFAALLWGAYQVLADLTVMGTPFLPETMARARAVLGLPGDARWDEIGRCHETARAQPTGPIYARITQI
ncbi:MAG TPA: methionine--tRNA ligase [Pseudomonadales bacterium]|nr:methionine--tRNA ligase [Pseudomonadales bacterium]